ncbi:MAG: DUF935 family protein [Thermodesulfobacteriota bacterium]
MDQSFDVQPRTLEVMMRRLFDKYDFLEAVPGLLRLIAPRSRSLDWWGGDNLLPDPDPVLNKLGQGLNAYRRLMSDAHVWSCCQSRKAGTLAREWEIRPGGPGAKDQAAYKLVQSVLVGLDVYQIVSDILEAPFFGLSPIEVIWSTGPVGESREARDPAGRGTLISTDAKWRPVQVIGRPPEWFAFDPENNLRFLSRDHLWQGELVPEGKFFLPRHHATYQNPYGERLLARCFWPVTFKRGGFKFWSIFAEKFGSPWVVGKVPRGSGETERAAILEKLAAMVQDAVAVINDDEKIEFPEAQSKQASAEVFERLISAANREISKAILGQTLTTELDRGGSYAAAREHMEVRADLIEQDKRLITQTFNQLFAWICRLNFAEAKPPVFAFYEEEDIRKDRAERDEILVRQGLKLSRAYYSRAYRLMETDLEPIGGAAV